MLTELAALAGQRALRVHLSLPYSPVLGLQMNTATPSFYVDVTDLNSAPQAWPSKLYPVSHLPSPQIPLPSPRKPGENPGGPLRETCLDLDN